MRRLAAVALLLVGCSTAPEPRHLTVREGDPQMISYSPGDRVDVIMDRRYGDVNDAYMRCLDMGGKFREVGWVCARVDF